MRGGEQTVFPGQYLPCPDSLGNAVYDVVLYPLLGNVAAPENGRRVNKMVELSETPVLRITQQLVVQRNRLFHQPLVCGAVGAVGIIGQRNAAAGFVHTERRTVERCRERERNAVYQRETAEQAGRLVVYGNDFVVLSYLGGYLNRIVVNLYYLMRNIILGDDEIAKNVVVLRDMQSGAQSEVSMEEIIKKLTDEVKG